MNDNRPTRFGLAQLRLALAAPQPAAGLTSEWRLINGIPTHCRRSLGLPGEIPIVMVHGLAVSHRYLAPLAAALGATHPVFVPDLPGFGLSGKPRRAYDVIAHAEHLAHWLAAYALPSVCLLGHSFGAEVAAALAARQPKTLQALILAGTTSDPASRSLGRQLGRWLIDAPREALLQAPILVRDVYDAGPRRVYATLCHSVRNTVEADLVRVTAPTLVVTGERDPIVPPPWRETVAALVPGSRLVILSGAAHNVTTTAAPAITRIIREFLQ